ncbi:hypothetical protein Q0X79_11755, partial [Neisseria sp. MVDL18-041461]|nr:hypothetical protein [Neisseria sp. MVDL19-042950]MDO1517285.1 hypothetical protein [Neisseria sp. MVDL18-041461]MDO1564647.1 hypothetical protein [Neisseria sp. MVDL20-010259]
GYIKLKDGEIEIGQPKVARVKAAAWEVTEEAEHKYPLPRFTINKGVDIYYTYDDLMPVVNAPFDVHFEDGTIISGVLDENGYAHIEDAPNGRFHVVFGEDIREWKPVQEKKKQDESAYTEEEIHRVWLNQENSAHKKEKH